MKNKEKGSNNVVDFGDHVTDCPHNSQQEKNKD